MLIFVHPKDQIIAEIVKINNYSETNTNKPHH